MKKLFCIIGIIFATMMSTTAFAEMFSFQSVLGVNDISDIQSAVIVGDNGKCADIEQEDLQQWLNVYWNFQGYEPVILPQSNNGYYYIKLWNKDKTKSYVVNANSGILVGRYGEPSKSHGEVKENYLWYFPYIGNARNALYTENSILQTKYLYEGYNLRDVTWPRSFWTCRRREPTTSTLLRLGSGGPGSSPPSTWPGRRGCACPSSATPAATRPWRACTPGAASSTSGWPT